MFRTITSKNRAFLLSHLVTLVAKWLDIINVAIIALALLLLTLAISIDTDHNVTGANFDVEHSLHLTSADYKSLGNNRLWFVYEEFGGGVIITDSIGQVKNKLSGGHYNIFLASQYVLLALIISACLSVLFLMVNTSYVRLVAYSCLIIIIISELQIVSLFSSGTGATLPIIWQAIILILIASIYWLFNKSLLKNNHSGDTLIAYASQSGSAMSLAKRFKKSLSHRTEVRCLSSLTPSCLTQYNEVLFVASTYGDGQPPEKAQRFMRKLAAHTTYVKPVQFSILALGDSQYPHFCEFGHQLNKLLTYKGAKEIFGLVEVDKLDRFTIVNWWQQVTAALQWKVGTIKQEIVPLSVVSNTCLNPSQTHRQGHVLQLSKQQLKYYPGDLLEVIPQRNTQQCQKIVSQLNLIAHEQVIVEQQPMTLIQALTNLEWWGESADNAQQLVNKLKPFAPRVYSIVSAPHQDHIDIFVRRHHRTDGSEGVASSYLCDLALDQKVQATTRSHANFHLPATDVPLILIGAGTGIAPLIGFLRHRADQKSGQKHWLFFGEQHKESDFYFKDEISDFCSQKVITKINLAWSRDIKPSYIGKHISQHKNQLLDWINDLGAYIYICGNKRGFGDSVCAELTKILGEALYKKMRQQDRLRTDLY